MRIYVASSWRNDHQPKAVSALRALGHQVYDFKDSDGFSWKETSGATCADRHCPLRGFTHFTDHQLCSDSNWVPPQPEESWTFGDWQDALVHPAAERGFARDMSALTTAHACVLVLPSGRSAHLEAGYAIGQGKPTAIWVPEYDTPDLMVKMADFVTDALDDILGWIGGAS